MIVIIDYGMGNLRSVQKALEKVGGKTQITQNTDDIKQADKIVLPGVGAMKPAMDKLTELGLIDSIKIAAKSGKPFLGICLGLQLLFEKSDEGGDVTGLGLLKGRVVRFSNDEKVPHMGWNQLNILKTDCPLFNGVDALSNTYFCHSYYVSPSDNVTATSTDYGITFTSSVWKDNIFGVQFHPEKSQATGLKILENFTRIKL